MSSDEHTPDEESRSDSDTSSDSGSEHSTHFIDDEAEEADSDASATLDLDDTPSGFPLYTSLPAELRRHIWELFCPDLVAKSRVLTLTVYPSSHDMRKPDVFTIADHFTLADQTEELRAMLATHQESRSIAEKAFPEELHLDGGSGDAVVRLNKETDVVYLSDSNIIPVHYLEAHHFPETLKQLHHLAIDNYSFGGRLFQLDIKNEFPRLKRLYFTDTDALLPDRKVLWCGTDYVHRYVVQTYQKEIGLGEDLEILFCWPDVDRHPDFARHSASITLWGQVSKLATEGARYGVEVLPMVEFEFERGLKRMDQLRQMKDIPVLVTDFDDSDEEDADEDESPEGTDQDEYESEGIDDEVIEEPDGSSEDEIIPSVDAGRFSSPDISDDEVEEVEPIHNSRKRRVVSDSEDEEPRSKRLRSRAVVDSDSDEEPQTSRGRPQVIVNLDDDDDEEDDEQVTEQPQKRGRGPRAVIDSDDDDDDLQIVQVRPRRQAVTLDSEDEQNGDGDGSAGNSGDEDEPPQRPSLAERLRRAREDIPVSGSEEESDEEDDEEEEEDDEEDEEDEDGLLDMMADEGDEDDEEEDDGW